MADWGDMRTLEHDWLDAAHANAHLRFEIVASRSRAERFGVILCVDGRFVAHERGATLDDALESLMVRLGEIREAKELAA